VEGDYAFLVIEASGDTPNPVGLAIVSIVAGLVQDIGQDQQAAGQSGGQPEEVDKGNELMSGHAAKGQLKIIPDHEAWF
jgi:hypothetical protein